jgi:hypothetical protein
MHAMKCSSYIFTNKSFEFKCRRNDYKEYGFLEDAHLLWNDVKEKFS